MGENNTTKILCPGGTRKRYEYVFLVAIVTFVGGALGCTHTFLVHELALWHLALVICLKEKKRQNHPRHTKGQGKGKQRKEVLGLLHGHFGLILLLMYMLIVALLRYPHQQCLELEIKRKESFFSHLVKKCGGGGGA